MSLLFGIIGATAFFILVYLIIILLGGDKQC